MRGVSADPDCEPRPRHRQSRICVRSRTCVLQIWRGRARDRRRGRSDAEYALEVRLRRQHSCSASIVSPSSAFVSASFGSRSARRVGEHQRRGGARRRLGALDAGGNQPAGVGQRERLRNAQQHRPSDPAAVRDRRLLGLSARARSRQSGARGDGGPARRKRRARADASDGRAGGPGRRAACGRNSSPTPPTHPRFKYFPEAGEDPYRSFLGVPIVERGLLQGVLVVQTIEAADLRRRRHAPADDGGRAAGADRHRSAHPRAVRRARAPAAGRSRPEPLVELGPGLDEPLSRARSGPVAHARQQPGRAAAADPGRQARGAGLAARAAQPHQLRLSPAAGVPALEEHLGSAPCRRPLGASGRLLLRGVRHPRVAADLLGRPRHPRRRSHQERVGSRHSARRRRPVLRPGLLQAAARSRRMAARGLHRRRSPVAPDPAGAQPTACR